MSVPKLYVADGVRGEAEAIRIMFKEVKQVCSRNTRTRPFSTSHTIQPFEEVQVDAAGLAKFRASGVLLFNELPMLEWGDIKLVERAINF